MTLLMEPEPEQKPEPELEPGSELIPETTAQVLVAVSWINFALIVLGHSCVILLIRFRKELKTVTNYFLLSLSFADLCVAFFVIPMETIGQYSEPETANVLCKLCQFASHLSTSATVFSIMCIAADRFMSIVFPLKRRITAKECALVIGALWGFSALYGLRAPLVFSLHLSAIPGRNGTTPSLRCGVPHENSSLYRYLLLFDFAIVFLFPVATLAICNVAIACVLRRSRVQSSREEETNKKRRKVIVLLFLLISVFVVCNFPIHILRMCRTWGDKYSEDAALLEKIFDSLFHSNSWINVILYAYMDQNLKNALKTTLLKYFCFTKTASGSAVLPLSTIKTT